MCKSDLYTYAFSKGILLRCVYVPIYQLLSVCRSVCLYVNLSVGKGEGEERFQVWQG